MHGDYLNQLNFIDGCREVQTFLQLLYRIPCCETKRKRHTIEKLEIPEINQE